MMLAVTNTPKTGRGAMKRPDLILVNRNRMSAFDSNQGPKHQVARYGRRRDSLSPSSAE